MKHEYNKADYEDAKAWASAACEDLEEETKRNNKLESAFNEAKERIFMELNLDVKIKGTGKQGSKEKYSASQGLRRLEKVKKDTQINQGLYEPNYKILTEGMIKITSYNNNKRIEAEIKGRELIGRIKDLNKHEEMVKHGVMIEIEADAEQCLVVKAKLAKGWDDSRLMKIGKRCGVSKRAMTRLGMMEQLIRLEEEEDL